MTDHFEQAQQRILKEAKENGGVTTDHLLDALIATNEDLDDQHKQTHLWHQQVCRMVEEHIEEAKVRDKRITVLEGFAEESRKTCKERVEKLIRDEHDVRHTDHVKEMHSLDEEAYDIKKLYRTLRWVAIVLGGGILLILADQLGNLIFGGAT